MALLDSSLRSVTLAFLAFLASPLYAANFISTWNGVDGNWNTPALWTTPGSPASFPNNGANTFDVVFSNLGTATLTQNIVIRKLTLSDANAIIAGNFNLTLNDNLTWTAGTITGTGAMNVAGTASTIGGTGVGLARTLTNSGTITQGSNSFLSLQSNAGIAPGILNNTGTYNMVAGCDIGSLGGNVGQAINNSGTWNVSGVGATSYVFDAPFNNSSAVNVTSGTFDLSGGGTSTGSFAVAAAATLSFSGGTYNLNAGAYNLLGKTSVGGGTANFNTLASTAQLDLLSGSLGGSKAVSVTGNLAWTGGTMQGTGTTTAAGTASTISGRGFKALLRTFTNSGTINHSATVDSDSGDTFVFAFDQNEAPGVLNNAGTYNLTGGPDFGYRFGNGNVANAINNSGTWNVANATFTSNVLGIAFNNTGTVNVSSGVLALNGGGTSTGSFVVSSGGTLRFAGGTHNLNAGSSITGAGNVEFGDPLAFVSLGSTWSFNAGTYNVGGTTFIKDGTASFNAPATTAALDVSGGSLLGTGTLAVTGNLHWTGGAMQGTGTINVAGLASTISGSNASLTLGRRLNNTGTMTMNGGWIYVSASGTTPGVLNNSGTFNVTADSDIEANFDNSGTVNVTVGTLTLRGGGTSTGNFAISAGGKLEFDLGTYLLDNGTAFSGAGLISHVEGNLSAGDAASDVITAATFNLSSSSATLTGSGAFNIGKLTWVGGTMEGLGTTNATGAASTISGSDTKALGRILNNSGTITYSSGSTSKILFGMNSDVTPGVLNNTGTFNVTAGGDFEENIPNAAHAINNSGTWNVSGATFTSDVNGVAFNNSGTANVTSGTLGLGGGGTSTGAFTVSAGATLSFTGGAHLLKSGVSFPGPGLVKVAGGAVTFGDTAPTVISAGNFALSGGTMDGAGTVNIGNLAWTGGTMDDVGTSIVSGLGSTISGTGLKGLNRKLNNTGTITYSSGDGRTIFFGFNGSEPGVLNNSGTFNVTAGGDFTQSIGNPSHAINNSGTWNVSGPTFTSNVTGIAFQNTGTVNVTSGTFALGGGGTSTGSFAVSSGAMLSFIAGTHLLDHGATFTGAGTARVAGGTITVGDAPNDVVTGGAFGVAGGTLDGLGTFNIGNLTWTAGTMRGTGTTAVSGAASTISGNGLRGLDRKLNNSGTIAFPASDTGTPLFFGLNAGETGILNNSGTFNVTAGGDFSRNYANASHAINNSGAWNVSGAGTTSHVTGIAFHNTGIVNVQTGTLALHGGDGGSTTGDFNVSAGATLLVDSNFNFAAGSNLTGQGGVIFGGGSSHLQGGAHTIAAISVTAATLNIHASQTFTALNIGANGTVIVGASASANSEDDQIGFVSANHLDGTAPVPEPGSLSLLALGLPALLRRHKKGV